MDRRCGRPFKLLDNDTTQPGSGWCVGSTPRRCIWSDLWDFVKFVNSVLGRAWFEARESLASDASLGLVASCATCDVRARQR